MHLFTFRLAGKYIFNKHLKVFIMLWLCNVPFLFAQKFSDTIIVDFGNDIKEVEESNNLTLHFTRDWKYKVGDDTLWKATNFDDNNWKELSEMSGNVDFSRDSTLKNVLGTIWFRSEFYADSNMVNKPLALYLIHNGSAAEAYIDGKFLWRFSNVGQDSDSGVTLFGPRSRPYAFTLSQQGKHSIAVRFSSFQNNLVSRNEEQSNTRFKVYVRNTNEVIDELANSSKYFPLIFLFAIFLTLGIVHIISFFYFRSDRLNLFFGLYCIGIAFILIYNYYLVSNSGDEIFQYLNKIASYMAPVIVVPLVALYHTIYYQRLSRFFWINVGLYLLSVVTNLLDFKISGFLLALIIGSSVIEIFRTNIRSIIKGKDGAFILGLGLLAAPACFILLIIVAVLHIADSFTDWYVIILVCSIVFSIPFSITLYLARRFARLNKSLNAHMEEIRELSEKTIEQEKEKKRILEVQNTRLESMVAERTQELKQRHQQLIQSEKMASVGVLTAGVAHEINNPINFVSASITPLKRDIDEILVLLEKYNSLDQDNYLSKLPEILQFRSEMNLEYITSELKALINGIEQGSKRTAEIVKGLRNFSRLDEEEMKMANVNDCIESTLLLLHNKLRHENIEVIKSLGQIPEINCYPGPLNQVFMNILTNASDAIAEALADQPSAEKERERKIYITTSFEDASVKISIRDTGNGMNEEVKKKIFDPFFTTKDVGKGTGLGLSISYGIIEKHHGRIEIKSEEGKGTEFRIMLPAVQEKK